VAALAPYDGDESFLLAPFEGVYCELVAATDDEQLLIQQRYRLLRMTVDFRRVAA
jgi:hypothetical protein